MKYVCEKHGELSKDERIMWSNGISGRWCIYCVNEMMDKFCGKLIEVDEDLINKKEK